MPTFIVLHTTTPTGVRKAWDELGRVDADDAATAFQTVTQSSGMDTGEYLVLPLAEQLTATVETTVDFKSA